MAFEEWQENKWINITALAVFVICASAIAISIVHKKIVEKRNYEKEFQEWQLRRTFDEEGNIMGGK